MTALSSLIIGYVLRNRHIDENGSSQAMSLDQWVQSQWRAVFRFPTSGIAVERVTCTRFQLRLSLANVVRVYLAAAVPSSQFPGIGFGASE